MSIEVETVVAISVMMAVFSAIAVIATAIVLGAGFKKLHSGFDIVRKQTGFFSDAIHHLEEKMDEVQAQKEMYSRAINSMEGEVGQDIGENSHKKNTNKGGAIHRYH